MLLKLWYWRRVLIVPWTARRSSQSILKEINPEYSLEGLMLKLKLQYFDHLMWRADSLEKTLMLGKTEGKRRRGRQRMRWLDVITDSMVLSLSKLREIVEDGSLACCSPWGCTEWDTTERLSSQDQDTGPHLLSAPGCCRPPFSPSFTAGSRPFHKPSLLLGIPAPSCLTLVVLEVCVWTSLPRKPFLPRYYFPSSPSFPQATSHNCTQTATCVIGLFTFLLGWGGPVSRELPAHLPPKHQSCS